MEFVGSVSGGNKRESRQSLVTWVIRWQSESNIAEAPAGSRVLGF